MTTPLDRIADTVKNFKNTSATAEAKEASQFVFVETEQLANYLNFLNA